MPKSKESHEVEAVVESNDDSKRRPTKISWRRARAYSILVAIIGCIISFAWFQTFVAFVDNYELGYTYDRMTGKMEKMDRTGWVVRTPIRYNVHTIDLRPYQVSINANARILNAKLVQFNPEGIDTFVKWHGRGAGQNVEDLKQILMSYAFAPNGGVDCPFLTVIGEIAPKQTPERVGEKETK